jgi:ribose transport system permease protein
MGFIGYFAASQNLGPRIGTPFHGQIVAGFDLSIGSVMALSGVIVVEALPMGKPVAIVLALATASAIGLANGTLISGLRLNPFIATLGTMVVVRGLVMTYTNAHPVPGTDPSFMSLGRATVFGGFPLPGLIFAAALVLIHLLLRSLKIGREVYALGGNEESARSSGIATYRARCSPTLTVLHGWNSGIVLAARLNTGSPVIGENTALNVITAVLLGGASLSGGIGSALGSFGGLLCIGLLGNALNLFDVPAYYQRIAQGLLLLLLVVLERIVHRPTLVSTRGLGTVRRLAASSRAVALQARPNRCKFQWILAKERVFSSSSGAPAFRSRNATQPTILRA